MAESPPEEPGAPRDGEALRAATTGAEVLAAAEWMDVSPAALAPALLEPTSRLLVGPGACAHLRRQWSPDGTAEVVLYPGPGVELDRPEVLAAAAGWGCERVRHRFTGDVLAVPQPRADAPLVARFRHLAALAASRVEAAVALTRDVGADTVKPDGSPKLAADEAAHAAAAEVLAGLGVPLLSEEVPDPAVPEAEPWIVLDPLDGTGNFRAGLPPWGFSAGLVEAGRPVAGLVADLSSGRRWTGVVGEGAERDGVPIRPRPGTTVIVPSAPPGQTVAVPSTARRIRITGCTAVELCLVADGSAAAWHDVDRSGTHVHDVAGGLAVLLAAGGVALTPDGEPVLLRPDTGARVRLVAAPGDEAARELLGVVGPGRAR